MKSEIKLFFLLGIVMLAACANKEPVQKFATTTHDFVKSFNGFAAKAKGTCQLKYLYMDLDSDGSYNGDPDASEYKGECTAYDQSYKVLKVYSKTVSSYAESLGKLAGLKGDVFNDDIDSVSAQLAKWKSAGGQTVDEKAVAAATKLIKSAAESVTGLVVDSKIKDELKRNHDDLVIVVDDMKKFASRIQAQNLRIAKKYIETPLVQLQKLSYVKGGDDKFVSLLASGTESGLDTDAKGARLPYRMLQAEFYKKILLINDENNALKSFEDSCDALVKAHEDLRDNFGELSKDEMLAKIREFYNKVKEANENFLVLRS